MCALKEHEMRMMLVAVFVAGACAGVRAEESDAKLQARAHFRAGTAFFEVGSYDRAIEEYHAAYLLLPLPDFLFNLGQASRLKGDLTVAAHYYREYLTTRPTGRVSDEARNRLREITGTLDDQESRSAAGQEPPSTKILSQELPPESKPAPAQASQSQVQEKMASAQLPLPIASPKEAIRIEEHEDGATDPAPTDAVDRRETMRAAVAAPARASHRPLYRRWWLWTAAGAIVAGVAVGVGVGVGAQRTTGNVFPAAVFQ
jgi:iron complex outermembrane receptor protein